MIKAIKVKKEMTFLQLIEAASRYKLHDGGYWEYPSDCKRYVVRLSPEELDYVKDIKAEEHLGYYPNIPYDTTFTVEVEEGITDDTDFEDITVVFESKSAYVTGHFYNSNLKKIKKAENLLSAYIPINGKLELIWEADSE